MHRKHFFDRPKSKTSIYDDLSSASLPSLMMKDGIDHGKDQSCQDRPTSSQTAANMMERLPQEIILGILSRLLIASLVQSKLVCRAWKSLIQDPLLVSEHFSHMADNDPSFILQSHWPASYQLYFNRFL